MKQERPFRRDPELARRAGRKGGSVSAAQRRASMGPACLTIIELMDAAGMVGDQWLPWRAFWKAVYALPMTAEELAIFQRHTKRDVPPAQAVAEAWMCIGRGGGKTRNSALHAVYRAITFDASKVAKGEDVIIPLLASDRRQAKIGLKYIREGFNVLPLVAPYVNRGMLKELIEYKTGANVEVVTASTKAPRGYSCPTANCDEIASWHNDDDGANPDAEVIIALRGSLGRVKDSVLLVLSNPAAPKGELYAAVEQFYGRDDPDVLVWVADTLSMNPTYDRRAIARLFKKDPVVAMSEFGADGVVTFRQGRSALFDADPLNACVVIDQRELPPVSGTRYYAFVDMAEGSRSGDSATLAIAHRDGGRAILDLLREVEPKFSPGQVIMEQFAPVLRQYGCTHATGDRHAVGFVTEFFDSCGIKFVPSVHSKSELYGELLPLVNTGLCALLDHPTLKNQLLALERRSVRGGRDSIDHPRGGHDDVANVCAGALVLASGMVKDGKKFKGHFSFGGDNLGIVRSGSSEQRTKDQLAMLGELTRKSQAGRVDSAQEAEDAEPERSPNSFDLLWRLHRGQ